jgi:DNA (cytosine-5)-methyltransferase 1
LKSLELFAGAGGLSLGIHQAGFSHSALVEWNDQATKTLGLNCKNQLGIGHACIHHVDARHFDLTPYEAKVDLLAGGPPCQPFSTSGKSLSNLDPRDMFPVFLDSMRKVRPKAFLIENVKGLLRPRFEDYFQYLLLRAMYPFVVSGDRSFSEELAVLRSVDANRIPDDEKYRVTYQLIDTADYGVPQRRERVIITGFRADLGVAPKHMVPTHSKESLLREQFITKEYWERRGIRKINYIGDRDKNIVRAIENEASEKAKLALCRLPWKTVRDAISDLPQAVERGKAEKFPNHVQHPGARIYKGHIGSFHDMPAKALKAGTHGTPGGENVLRINNTDRVRYFTTREAARLHTFPDTWTFNGETWGSCITQLGNAVPVSIGKLFADYIFVALKDKNLGS